MGWQMCLRIFLKFHPVKSGLWFVDTEISHSKKMKRAREKNAPKMMDGYTEGSIQHMSGVWYFLRVSLLKLYFAMEFRYNCKLFQLNEFNFRCWEWICVAGRTLWLRSVNDSHLNINHFRQIICLAWALIRQRLHRTQQ